MMEFTGGPGFAAFIATFSIVLVTLVLIRSLNRQLRKVRTSHHDDADVMHSDGASGMEDGNRDGNEVTGETRDS